MTQTRQAEPDRCGQCDGVLCRVPCRACNAKGFIRKWLIFKDECWICSGDGFRLRCPDEVSHSPGHWRPRTQSLHPEPRPWYFSHPDLWYPASPRYGSTHTP